LVVVFFKAVLAVVFLVVVADGCCSFSGSVGSVLSLFFACNLLQAKIFSPLFLLQSKEYFYFLVVWLRHVFIFFRPFFFGFTSRLFCVGLVVSQH